MTTAIFSGRLIAESQGIVIVEGNYCFPPALVRRKSLSERERTSVCSGKGTALSYTESMDGETADAATRSPRQRTS
ncbi:MAG: DUF427 domain-containing protein [Acidimicrobiales bacterium]